MQIDWKIEQIKVLPQQNERKNIVKTISFMLEGTRDEKTHFVLGSVDLSFYSESENFIKFEDLTEEMVIAWVKDALGIERINQYIDTIEQRFGPEGLVESTLPWAQSEPELVISVVEG